MFGLTWVECEGFQRASTVVLLRFTGLAWLPLVQEMCLSHLCCKIAASSGLRNLGGYLKLWPAPPQKKVFSRVTEIAQSERGPCISFQFWALTAHRYWMLYTFLLDYIHPHTTLCYPCSGSEPVNFLDVHMVFETYIYHVNGHIRIPLPCKRCTCILILTIVLFPINYETMLVVQQQKGG